MISEISLSPHLTLCSNESRYILDSDGVLNIQSVALALHTSLVYQDTSVSRQSCKRQSHVIIEGADLTDRPGVLELG